MGFAAVILAGGRARRMGGVDKVGMLVGGRTLLDRSLAAVAGADPVVVVGPVRPVAVPVRWIRERPAGAGPLAGLAAGLTALPGSLPDETEVAVLAGDLIGVLPETVRRLRAALRADPAAAGAVLVDAEGYRQWLHGVWLLRGLREAVGTAAPGAALRDALGRVPRTEVAALPGEADDVDRPEDLP